MTHSASSSSLEDRKYIDGFTFILLVFLIIMKIQPREIEIFIFLFFLKKKVLIQIEMNWAKHEQTKPFYQKVRTF